MIASSSTPCIPRTSAKDVFLKRTRILAVIAVFFLLSMTVGQTGGRNYVIRKGDTLWDIAFRYLGDPFQWPRLWHQNPSITNPNLIYPGNSLAISGGEQTGSTSSSASSVAGDRSGENEFTSETKQAIEQSERKSAMSPAPAGSVSRSHASDFDTLSLMSMQRKSYFTPDFLEAIAFLWEKRDVKDLVCPGNAVLIKSDDPGLLNQYGQQTFHPFDEVRIRPLVKAQYRPGDTVNIFHSYGLEKFQGKTVNVVRRIAKARVHSVERASISADIVDMWDIVRSGDRVDTLTHFPCYQIDSLETPGISLRGTIFYLPENTVGNHPFQSFIIDKGATDGVRIGDIFAVKQKNKPSADRPAAIACALNVGTASSTLVIEKLFDRVDRGDTVSLINRLTFK